MPSRVWILIATFCLVGCASGRSRLVSSTPVRSQALKPALPSEIAKSDPKMAAASAHLSAAADAAVNSPSLQEDVQSDDAVAGQMLVGDAELADESDGQRQSITQTAAQVDVLSSGAAPGVPPAPANPDLLSTEIRVGERRPVFATTNAIDYADVVDSVYRSYPLLESALFNRNIAAGDQLSAEGAYDLKLKGASENMPVGYYRNYRQSIGLEQETYYGGQVFGGYRIGRGDIQPWYQERLTNEGGEFMAGFTVPLAQNRTIDPRRAELWKATYGRNAVEPQIQSALIDYVYGGSIAYWSWVASGLHMQYAQQLYDIALERDKQLKQLVENGAMAESVLVDNQRLIVSRQVKLIEAKAKLQQAAVKLSLFLRDEAGMPIIPEEDQLPAFPEPLPVQTEQVDMEIAEALNRRPELRELDFSRRIAEVDLAQAHNLTQPAVDATLWSAQDVGAQSSSSGSKQPLELQGMVNVSVPLQRRSARGKIQASEAKITQIQIKRGYVADQIETEVRNATIALDAAFRAIQQARSSVALNLQMQEFETLQLDEGSSDLLRLNLREQQTFDARLTEVDALFLYFRAQAELRAAAGVDADGLLMIGQPASP